MVSKVAIITGGASGMGLATAQRLYKTGQWTVHILDLNPSAGEAALITMPNAIFHQANVAAYGPLSCIFQAIFDKEGHVDVVFANAGIVERHSFYERPITKGSEPPPPPPTMSTLDINMAGVISTVYLAMHYMRLSPHRGKDAAIVMTSSVGGLYPSEYTPVYAASKAGVVNFMRSLARPLHRTDGIRTYAICPGTVRTNLLREDEWTTFPQKTFTPVDKIASTVQMLAEGGDMVDSKGVKVERGKDYGLAVEVHGRKHYFREQLPFCDEEVARVMAATSMDNQQAAFDEVKRREKMGPATEHIEHIALQ